jgi:hypothetical protein
MQRESLTALRGEIRMLQEQLQASEVTIYTPLSHHCMTTG